MTFTQLTYDTSINGIAIITMNRPEKRNAFDSHLVKELVHAFELAEHDADVRVMILRANGKAFCAGADLQYLHDLQGFTIEQNLADSESLRVLFQSLYLHKKITIAQVQGHALAGGCGLATACDFCFAGPEAIFGYTEVKIGFMPALVMVYLRHKVGEGRAKQLLLSGNLFSAEQAKDWGMITDVFPMETLEGQVMDFANKMITHTSGQAQQATKKMLHDIKSMSMEEAFVHAATQNAHARMSPDCKKGISAFLSKEELRWN